MATPAPNAAWWIPRTKKYNTNHAVVGYYTAKSWRLPEHVTQAIANHHNALAIFSDESSRNTPLKKTCWRS